MFQKGRNGEDYISFTYSGWLPPKVIFYHESLPEFLRRNHDDHENLPELPQRRHDDNDGLPGILRSHHYYNDGIQVINAANQ